MDHSLSDPTASSSAMAPATTSRDGTPTPRSNKPPSAICLNELLMSRDGEEEEDLFMASPPANTTFNTSRASRGPTTHGGHGGTEGGELESVAVGFSTTTAIVHITGTGNGGALSPSRTTTSPDHFTSEYYYAGMAHLHGASKTDEEAKVRRRLPEARAGSSVGSSHAGEDGALEASPPTTEERTRGVLLPAGDDVGAPAHYLTSPHHQQQHLLSSEPSGASPPTARHLAPLPLPTTTPSRPLSYKEYRRQQRCKPRIGGGGNVANRGFTVGRGTTGLREGCNTNNNNSTALPSRSDSGVMGSSDGGTSNPSSLPLQAALYAALKSERDEEYLKWRSDRLSRSLYHTFQNTTNNNNNNNNNSGCGGGEPQKRKHSPLPLQLAMGSVVPPTEEMMDFEERRRRAIATERRARRKDREQSRHQHEAVVLDRRRRGLRGEAVDLPDCFYALVEEVGPLQSGVSVPPREAITANDHRKACAAQRILAQNQRVLMEEDRHIAAHEMKKQLHDALSAARTDEENFTKARREGSRRIDCHETQARLEAKRAEQRGVAMQNRLRTEYDRMWANKYRIHEEEEELRRRQALREKVPGGGVVVSRHRSTSVVDSPTTIVPVPNSVPRQSAARPATGAGRAESAQHRQQSRVVFEPTPPLPGTRTSNAAPVVEQPSSAAPTKANSIVASDTTTNNNNKNNSTVANTTTTTALQSVKPSEVTAPSIHDPTSTNFFSEMKQWNTRFQSPNNTPASGRDPAHRRAWLQQLASDRQTFNDHSVNIIREELPAKMELAREEMYAAKVASADHSRGERAQLLQRRQQHHEEDRQHAAGVHAQYCDQLERLRQVRKDRVSELHRQADANRHTSEGCFLTAVEDGVRPPTS